jgi:hypothetical protein
MGMSNEHNSMMSHSMFGMGGMFLTYFLIVIILVITTIIVILSNKKRNKISK